MNRRFIVSFAVAALLGLACSQAVPVEPEKKDEPVVDTKTDAQLQTEFLERNAVLEKT